MNAGKLSDSADFEFAALRRMPGPQRIEYSLEEDLTGMRLCFICQKGGLPEQFNLAHSLEGSGERFMLVSEDCSELFRISCGNIVEACTN